MIAPDLQQLGQAVRQSDRKAFKTLFEAMRDALYRYAVLLVRDSDAAYDIVQEVFIKLWDVRHTLDAHKSLKSLLFQMTRNRSLNYIRDHQQRRTDWEDVPEALLVDDYDVEADIDLNALQSNLNQWIRALPGRRKEVFMLSRYDGLSHEEIANVLEISPRTVNNHLGFALHELRQKVLAFVGGNTP